ncbi:MAG TPA: TolC family protein [Gemmatimonadaceae bacterium]|nr:TolC family protein [Gemmatimonadaceae bacterium]
MWTPPPGTLPAEPPAARATPPELTPASLSRLTLGDVVDLALRSNPATRVSWAQARAAADAYGSSRGRWFPTLEVDANATRSQSLALPGRLPGERTQYGPSVTLSYLVLDFGGRSGAVASARATAIAADLTHNITVQNTILQVENALFGYLSTRALRDAQRATVAEAAANLQAAQERHRVGLATVADELQARTAQSQAQLALETLDGQLQIARGALAVSMGLPANAAFEVPEVPAADSVHFVATSVDSLIELAVRERPDLAALRATAQAAAARVRVARAASLPALTFNGTSGYTGSDVSAFTGRTYTLTFGLQLPLFNGFSRQYDQIAAADELEAATARATLTRQQVALQVFSAYYGLQTATQRVHTAADLLASATESESVARGRYREGVGSIVDLLIAQSALADARAQDIQARWQWRSALAQLAHDAGVLGARGEPLAPLGVNSSREVR